MLDETKIEKLKTLAYALEQCIDNGYCPSDAEKYLIWVVNENPLYNPLYEEIEE